MTFRRSVSGARRWGEKSQAMDENESFTTCQGEGWSSTGSDFVGQKEPHRTTNTASLSPGDPKLLPRNRDFWRSGHFTQTVLNVIGFSGSNRSLRYCWYFKLSLHLKAMVL